MLKRLRRILIGPRFLAVLLLLGMAAVRVADPPWLETVRAWNFDSFQKLHPRVAESHPVAIIDIDEASLNTVGQWPWPRTEIAKLIVNAVNAGAVVVGFDVIFPEPDRLSPAQFAASAFNLPEPVAVQLRQLPSNDEILANVLRQAPVVLGKSATADQAAIRPDEPLMVKQPVEFNGDPRPFLTKFQGVLRNTEPLETSAQGLGMFSLDTEPDGVVRRVPAVMMVDGAIYPSLSVEMLRVATRQSSYGIRVDPRGVGIEGVIVARRLIPTNRHGKIWVRAGWSDRDLYVSAADVLANRFDPAALRGKLVLVGTSAEGLRDLRISPLGEVLPGVEIHAQVLESILNEAYLLRPYYALGLEVIVMVLAGAVLIALVPALGAGWGLAFFLVYVAGLQGGAFWVFQQHSFLLDPATPSVSAFALFGVLAYANYSRAESQKKYVRQAFSQFLAPALVEKLAEDPNALALGGETRDTTFLFTDIAGFTSFTERTDPQLLVELLNAYLDRMCAICMAHGATIDKIVGDAIHAMFNAPLDQPDHADRAIRCALALDAASKAFIAAQAKRGITFGETRIGIHSGSTVVGNFGGSSRFDYTAHGDAINTAARFESVNKHLGTTVCLSQAVIDRLTTQVPVRPVADLVMKGRSVAITAYEPLDAAQVASPRIQDYLAAYGLLRSGDPGADAAFKAGAEAYPDDPLFKFHVERFAQGQTTTTHVMSDK